MSDQELFEKADRIEAAKGRLRQELLDYFSEPDVSDCFTMPMMQEQPGMTRSKVVTKIKNGLKSGKIKFVAQVGSVKYYRWNKLDNEA